MLKEIGSRLIEAIVANRNRRFDNGALSVYQAGLPVVSIGNISTGGTGKTPVVIQTARFLIDRGWRVGIVSRGYGRESTGLVCVSEGSGPKVHWRISGDELFLASSKVPDAWVVASESRVEASKWLRQHSQVDIILLDDGFQHRYLGRDLDIVLLDRASLDSSLLFPFGILREPHNSLARAHLILVDRGAMELFDNTRKHIEATGLSLPPHLLIDRRIAMPETVSGEVSSKTIQEPSIAVSGLARPAQFEEALRGMGMRLTHILRFPDHHPYNQKDINRILRRCSKHSSRVVVTTEKDWVRLEEFKRVFVREGIVIQVVPLHIDIAKGLESFTAFLPRK